MSPQPPEGAVADSSGAAGPAAAAAPAVAAAPAAMPAFKAMTAPSPSPATNTEQEQQQQNRHRVAIVWFRRDLRVSDNPALMAAAAEADFVVRRSKLLFFFSQLHSVSPARSCSHSFFPSEALAQPLRNLLSHSLLRASILVLRVD